MLPVTDQTPVIFWVTLFSLSLHNIVLSYYLGKPVTLPLLLGHPVTSFAHYYIDPLIHGKLLYINEIIGNTSSLLFYMTINKSKGVI